MLELVDANVEGRQEIAGDRADVVVQERVLRVDRLRLRRAMLQNELLDVLRPVLHEGLVAALAVLQKNAERVFLLLLQVAQQLLQPRNARERLDDAAEHDALVGLRRGNQQNIYEPAQFLGDKRIVGPCQQRAREFLLEGRLDGSKILVINGEIGTEIVSGN